jgi:PAS domain S-box-containing protein
LSHPRFQTASAALTRKVIRLRDRLETHRGRPGGELDAVSNLLEEIQAQHEALITAGQALEEERQRYQALFHGAPDGYLATDAYGMIQDANRMAGDQLGLAADDLRRLPLAIFVAQGDRIAFWRFLTRLRQGHSEPEQELTLVPKQGPPFLAALTVSSSVQPAAKPGHPARPVGFCWCVRDITARRQAAAALQEAADFPDENASPVLRVRRDGALCYANHGSAPLRALWQCEVGGRLPLEWRRRVAHGVATGQAADVEVVCGETVYVCHMQPIAGRDYVNLYATDITRRKQAEAALQALNGDLEARIRSRTATLKAEITRRTEAEESLQGQTQRLRDLGTELVEAEQRERKRLAAVLHDGLQQLLVAVRLRIFVGERQGTIPPETGGEVRKLVDEAIISARSLSAELNPTLLDTQGLLPALEWLARWMNDMYRLSVSLTLHRAEEPSHEATKVLLFETVRELLFNTVKHAEVAAATVEVVAHDGLLEIVVADAGKGFDVSSLEGSTSRGLGLASIRQRLEYLGGRIEIASAPGQGSRFTLTAPLWP